jgi:hypothetical protein
MGFMEEPFDWEEIDNYERLTGIEPVDKALAYNMPLDFLRQHFARRERQDGRDAVVVDLTALVDAMPPGSPDHHEYAEWLRRYQAGASAEEL